MASFEISYNWMMDNEDPARAYKAVPDVGGMAISGINSRSFPDDYMRIAEMTQVTRGASVEEFYEAQFWNRWYEELASDEVAKRVFDMAVNGGAETAVMLLQRSVELADTGYGSGIIVDGKWGPRTVALANASEPGTLLQDFQEERIAHYKAIVAADPSKAKYLAGWIARAMK
jgi:lysozyme family protein